jgi:prophage antirepressor-like protein
MSAGPVTLRITRTAESLDADERGRYTVATPGGPQEMLCVTESGLYALTLKSRKPEAKRFRKWVTSEVLPAIRKTCVYSVVPPQTKRAMGIPIDEPSSIINY